LIQEHYLSFGIQACEVSSDYVGGNSIERIFSAIKYVKSQLSYKMDDQWLNDRLVTYIEIDVLKTISNDVILTHFQQMENRTFSL